MGKVLIFFLPLLIIQETILLLKKELEDSAN